MILLQPLRIINIHNDSKDLHFGALIFHHALQGFQRADPNLQEA